ncbi:MAG: HAMP domain-containing sensor histidine kinase [Chloroflexota bacterium]
MKSLRSRLLLTYIGLIVIGFGGLSLWAGQRLANNIWQTFTEDLQDDVQLIASTLVEPMENFLEEEQGDRQITTLVERHAAQARARVTLLDFLGNPIVDSSGQLPSGNLSQNPEIAAAQNLDMRLDRRLDEAGNETFFVATPIIYEGSEYLGIVRLAAAAATPETAVRQQWLGLATTFAVFTVLGILVSLSLSSSLIRPLTQLRNSALKMAEGDLGQRVQVAQEDEIGAVGTAFNQMAEQVETMVQEQSAFASNASHELRTPLTTIRLRTEWLQSDLLDAETTEQYIADIDAEAHRMSQLVEELTLLSKLDSKRHPIGESLLDPHRFARALTQELQERAATKSIDLELLPPADHLPSIQANLTHMRVVFRNLLDNGMKYTPAGGRVRWQMSQEGVFLRVVIADNGRGIAAEDLPNVTQRFFRTDKAHTRQIEGVGLGLALVDSIVRLYSGRWQIQSEGLGKGTAVTVWLPFDQANRGNT